MKHATVVSPVTSGTTIRANNSAPCTATGHGASLKEWITPGSLLVYVRMLRLPENVLVDGRCYGYWRILDPTCASALDQLVADSGWHFFRMEPVVDVRAFGTSQASALASALRKATGSVENENLNALEVVDLEYGTRVGLHTARILAFARHIQNGRLYNGGGRSPAFRPLAGQLDIRRRKLQ